MRMRIVTAVALALFLTGAASLPWTAAQEKTPVVQSTAKENETPLKSADSYKVEFTIYEQDNGKKINSRSYSMQIRDALPHWSSMTRLRVGSRVPVAVGASDLQYQDIGMNIDCQILPMANGKVGLGTNWRYSNVENEQERETGHPVIRQESSQVEAVVPMDKPTVIAEMDDVASTHRFVFEVKVTKITP